MNGVLIDSNVILDIFEEDLIGLNGRNPCLIIIALHIQCISIKDSKMSSFQDFFIGAHAAVDKLELITRDISRIRSYFPTVKLISPY